MECFDRKSALIVKKGYSPAGETKTQRANQKLKANLKKLAKLQRNLAKKNQRFGESVSALVTKG